jgi:hypothetical protein
MDEYTITVDSRTLIASINTRRAPLIEVRIEGGEWYYARVNDVDGTLTGVADGITYRDLLDLVHDRLCSVVGVEEAERASMPEIEDLNEIIVEMY